MEGQLYQRPGFVLPPDNGNRAVGTVEVVTDIQVALCLSEVRQPFDVGPLLVTLRSPTVEVLGESSKEHLAVDGAGATYHLALGHVCLALFVG